MARAHRMKGWSTLKQDVGLTGRTPGSRQRDGSLQRAAMPRPLPSVRTAPQWQHP